MLSKKQLIELLNSANIDFEVDQENPSIVYNDGLVEEYEKTQLPSAYLSNLNKNTFPNIRTKVSINQNKFKFSITSRLDNNFTVYGTRIEHFLGEAA